MRPWLEKEGLLTEKLDRDMTIGTGSSPIPGAMIFNHLLRGAELFKDQPQAEAAEVDQEATS